MGNLHVRLNTIAEKNIMKLVKLQNLIAKFGKAWKICSCKSFQTLYMFVLRAEIVTIFGSKMVTISARNANIQNMQALQGNNFRILQHFVTRLCKFTKF
jgi:hypothetical protein